MLAFEELKDIGISQYGFISPTDIEFNEEIRKICEGNSCNQYGKTWACPPAVGTVAQCKKRCHSYASAMVFCAVYDLENSHDYESMIKGHRSFKELCDKLYALIKDSCSNFLLLSNEGCNRCSVCSYPDNPCRMLQILFPSIEGYGINVMKLAEKANIKYNNGQNTVTFFGMLLY